MIVFKTFLKVLKASIVPVIMYTVILLFFGGFNMQTSDSQQFSMTKPDVFIVNNDVNQGITKSFITYIENNANIISLSGDTTSLKDALFYRDVNYIIYIPENFRDDFLSGKNPKIKVESTKDYQASLAEMMVERYLNVANRYNKVLEGEDFIIKRIEETLDQKIEISLTSKIDNVGLEKATFYYNFASYSILAGCVYVICLILSSFKKEQIKKRTTISSMSCASYNRKLLLSNSLFAFILWLFYVLLSFILVGSIMFTSHGLCYIVNLFVFTFCALTLAFLIGNTVKNKEAISGIVNVVALGSSFLCGAFVPMSFLPDFVLKLAHCLPSYWYIENNELLKTIEVLDFQSLQPIFINMFVMVLFAIVFLLVTRVSSKYHRRIG